MNGLQALQYRLKIRNELMKADKQLLDITKEELHREYERRNKGNKK